MAAELTADLVLEGGGVKGIALVGAISVLQEHGYRFNRVAGTSAGAIVGSLAAAGFGPTELYDRMLEVDYRKFRDGGLLDHLGVLGRGVTLLFEHGIYKGDYVRSWLAELLATKGVTTFEQLKLIDPESSLAAAQQYRLVAMTSDISHGRLRRLPWEYDAFGINPDEAQVADAVRASASIPFFFEPIKLQAAGKDVWLVDGGILSNFPIDTFDRTDGRKPRWPTFGIKLSARADALAGRVRDVHNTVEMTQAMIETMAGFHDQIYVDQPSVQARTIFVDTGIASVTDFGITRETQLQLYRNGRDAAEKFLATWDWDAYLARWRTPSTAPTT
jgi:NTE family protein